MVEGLQSDGYWAKSNDNSPPSAQWENWTNASQLEELASRPHPRKGELVVRSATGAASNLYMILATGQQPTLTGQMMVHWPTIDDASTFDRKLAYAMAAKTSHDNPWHEKRRGRSHVPHDLCTDDGMYSDHPVRCLLLMDMVGADTSWWPVLYNTLAIVTGYGASGHILLASVL